MADRKKPEPAKSAVQEIILPSDLQAEKTVLGAILSGTPFAAIADLLRVDDWSIESHRRCAARMAEIHARGVPVDRLTLANELRVHGQLESVGGLSFLADLGRDAPALENLAAHAGIIKTKSIERQLFTLNRRFAKGILSGSLDVRQALDSLIVDAQKLQDEAHARDQEDGSTPAAIIDAFPGGAQAFLDPTSRPRGIQTGFAKLDDMMGGFKGGELIVLGARPGMGKSSFAMNIAEFIIFGEEPQPVGVFSFEMSADSLLQRMASSCSRVSNYRIRHNYVNADERSRMQLALSKIYDAPLHVHDKGQRTIGEIISTIRRGVQKQGWVMTVIDYLQLINSSGRFNTKNDEVSDWTRRLKLLAMELNHPILLLSQLKRLGNSGQKTDEKRKPTLEDLRDSGSIEQDADAVALLHRPEVYSPDRDDLKGKAELLLAKQRNGPMGRIPLIFEGQFTRFSDPVE